jgi:hypothetical protein
MNLNNSDRMMQMITGYWVTQIVRAAARYSLADHLANGPATASDIARAESTNPSAAFRLMRACVSPGLLTYDSVSRFASTSLGHFTQGQSSVSEGTCPSARPTCGMVAMGALPRRDLSRTVQADPP